MSIDRLELVYRLAKQKDAVPVLFVHGIFSGAWIWEEHYLDWFANHGYHAYAVSLRGHGRSSSPDPTGQYSLKDYAQDLEDAIRTIEQNHKQPPLLVGHSMGGMVVQRFLTQHVGRGAVLLCSIPPQGMMPLSIQSLWCNPFTTLEMTQTYMMPEQATSAQLQRYMFSGPVDQKQLDKWLQYMVPESQRLIWDMSWNDLPNPFEVAKTPIAVVGAKQDQLVPQLTVTLTAATYGCKVHWVDSGHGVMLDHNWQDGAATVAATLAELLHQEEMGCEDAICA
ncbi:alpha/beta hydrolase [Oceanospirillum sp. HFRX-1_2]